MYSPDDFLYGKGLYYHVVADPHVKELIVAHVENPASSLIMRIVRCAAKETRRVLDGICSLPCPALTG